MTSTNTVTMYTTSWCGFCLRLKKQMSEAGIAFTEVDIEFEPEAAEFVGSINGGNHVVPTLRFPNGKTATNPSLAQVKALIDS